MAADVNRLQFVGADRLRCERTSFGGWEFRSAAGRHLGRFAGVVADTTSRAIRYFVVDRPNAVGPKRYLISFCPVQVDREARALRLQLPGVELSNLEVLRAQRA